MRWLRPLPPLVPLGFLLAACSPVGPTVPPGPITVAEPAIGVAVDPIAAGGLQPFPECQTDEFAFVGETSLVALGLGEAFGGGPEASRIGMIWVTANPVAIAQPVPAGGGKVADVPAQRWVCVQFADGSGMGGSVPDDWAPPTDVASAATQPQPAIPLGTVAVLIGAIVLIGVSVFAFRREGGPSGEARSA
jgi:hypothetical protein